MVSVGVAAEAAVASRNERPRPERENRDKQELAQINHQPSYLHQHLHHVMKRIWSVTITRPMAMERYS